MPFAIVFVVGLLVGVAVGAIFAGKRQISLRMQVLDELTQLKQKAEALNKEKDQLAQESADLQYHLNESRKNEKALQQRLNKDS